MTPLRSMHAVYSVPGHHDACGGAGGRHSTRDSSGGYKDYYKNFILMWFETLTGCSGIEYQNARLHSCSIEHIIQSRYRDFVSTKFFEVSEHDWTSNGCYCWSAILNWRTQCLSTPSDSCQWYCVLNHWQTELRLRPGEGDWCGSSWWRWSDVGSRDTCYKNKNVWLLANHTLIG